MPLSSATHAATSALRANRAPTSVGAQEVHKWMQDFNWDFKNNRTKYPTKYHMANDTKEQFKLIAKEYARMESVKDERQFGSSSGWSDPLNAGNRVAPEWGETMKVASNFLEVGEYNAIAGSAMLWDSASSPEQKNGYLGQVLDEIRHTNQCGYVNYYFSKHYPRSGRSYRRPSHPHDRPAVEGHEARVRGWLHLRRRCRVFDQPATGRRSLLHQPADRRRHRMGFGQWRRNHADRVPVDRDRRAAPYGQRLSDGGVDRQRSGLREVSQHRSEQRLLDAAEVFHAGAGLCCSSTAPSSRSSRGSRPGTVGSTKIGAASGSAVSASMA